MLEQPHHFGITVSNGKRSEKFYTRMLRMPHLATSVNRGRRYDEMYRLNGARNHVYWYQFGEEGTELFYLPTHHGSGGGCSRLDAPGWRYVAFDVCGFDDYTARLEAKGVSVRMADTTAGSGDPALQKGIPVHKADAAHGPCAKVTDPDGVNILLFDSGKDASVGRIERIREIGLVAADPAGYGDFFNTIGIEKSENDQSPGFLHELFDYGGDIETALFGCIRLLHLPGAALGKPPRMFPFDRQEETLDIYSDVGIKHICYYVDDINSFYRRAASAGVYFLFPPILIPGGSRMSYFSDPEGHIIEVMEAPPALRRIAREIGRLRSEQMDAFSRIGRKLGPFRPTA